MGSEQNDSTSFPPSEPILCANGCGFFGTAANMNLCSKCYRDFRAQEEQAASAMAAMEKTLKIQPKQEIDKTHKVFDDDDDDPVAVVKSSASSSTTAMETERATEPPKAANRCFCCNKKVGLTGFVCKCGSTYCGNHRYPENHDCSFDFKASGRDAIAKANPVIKADKIDKI